MNKLITEILRREGWNTYTNRPSDRGGPTKWGITQKRWSEYIGRQASIDEIKMITEEQARKFYRTEFIEAPGYSGIEDGLVQDFVVDCGVNHGPGRASRWAQQAAGVTVDGKFGPVSTEAVNAAEPISFLLRMIDLRIKFYATIASDQLPADPDLPNLRGWMNRATSFLGLIADRITAE